MKRAWRLICGDQERREIVDERETVYRKATNNEDDATNTISRQTRHKRSGTSSAASNYKSTEVIHLSF